MREWQRDFLKRTPVRDATGVAAILNRVTRSPPRNRIGIPLPAAINASNGIARPLLSADIE